MTVLQEFFCLDVCVTGLLPVLGRYGGECSTSIVRQGNRLLTCCGLSMECTIRWRGGRGGPSLHAEEACEKMGYSVSHCAASLALFSGQICMYRFFWLVLFTAFGGEFVRAGKLLWLRVLPAVVVDLLAPSLQ